MKVITCYFFDFLSTELFRILVTRLGSESCVGRHLRPGRPLLLRQEVDKSVFWSDPLGSETPFLGRPLPFLVVVARPSSSLVSVVVFFCCCDALFRIGVLVLVPLIRKTPSNRLCRGLDCLPSASETFLSRDWTGD